SNRRDERLGNHGVIRVPDHDLLVLGVSPELVRPARATGRNTGPDLMARVQVDDLHRAVAVAGPSLTAIAVLVVVAREVSARAVPVLTSAGNDDHTVGTCAVTGISVWAGAGLAAWSGAQPGEHVIAGADKLIILRVEDVNARVVAIGQNVGAPA